MTAVALPYRNLGERALTLFEGNRTPISAVAVVAALLGPAFARQPALVGQVEQMLQADPRFVLNETGDWILAEWQEQTQTLSDETFAVVDVETTGGQTERHHIVEVAVVLVRAGRTAGRYASLVNPMVPLPRFVSQFNGITQEMVDEAPSIEQVLDEVRAFVGNAVIVGHNVSCDLAFLNYEAVWHGLPPFGNRALDTQELAARLLPDLRKPSLSRVAAKLGFNDPPRHRALSDAEVTAQVLLHFLQQLAQQGVDSAESVQAWVASRLAQRQERVRNVRAVLPAGLLASLPDRAGVYFFKDAQGRVLYVGKAVSIRDRVAQHFTGSARSLRGGDGLLDQVSTVDHIAAHCELDALLLEAEHIEAHGPPYNVQEKTRRGCPFLHLEGGMFPRVTATREIAAGGGIYAGPYRTTHAARQMQTIIRRVFQIRSCRRALPATRPQMRIPCIRLGQGLCPAPCADAVTPAQYRVLVDWAATFVQRGRDATIDALDQRIAALACPNTLVRPAALTEDGVSNVSDAPDTPDGSPTWFSPGVEVAAGSPVQIDQWELTILRECRSRLLRVRKEHRPIPGGLAGESLVMVFRSEMGGALLLVIQAGVMIGRVHVPEDQAFAPLIGAYLQPLLMRESHPEALSEARMAVAPDGPDGVDRWNGQETPGRTGAGGAVGFQPFGAAISATQANIVLRWVYRHAGSRHLVPVEQDMSLEEVGAAAEYALWGTPGEVDSSADTVELEVPLQPAEPIEPAETP